MRLPRAFLPIHRALGRPDAATVRRDNLFATLLAASGAPRATADPASRPWGGYGFAVSNFFQVVKSKTAAGFVPNFAAGGLRSQDRTEPPIGAKVLSDLVKKFGGERRAWCSPACLVTPPWRNFASRAKSRPTTCLDQMLWPRR